MVKRNVRAPKARRRPPRRSRDLSQTRFYKAPARAPRRPLPLRAAGITDIGRRRDHNEDAFYCDHAAGAGLFIVADGMGGKAAGEAAARAVVTVFPALLRQALGSLKKPTPRRIKTVVAETLARLSRDLFLQSRALPALAGLGSTAVVLLVHDGVAYVGFAGDSRVYLLREKRLLCLTEDQTTAMALVKSGHLSLRDADRHPLSNSLEEYIGKELPLNPGTRYRRLRPGDRWLLCSDGLLKGLSDADLRRILRRPAGSDAASRELLTAANEADGSDNITALVVDVGR